MAIDRSKITTDDNQDTSFLMIKGQPIKSGMTLDGFTRPGINGVGFAREGNRGQPYQLLCIVDTLDQQKANDDANTFISKVRGKLITVTFATNKSGGGQFNVWSNVLCTNARIVQNDPALLIVGGLGASNKAIVGILLDCIDPF